MCVGVCVGGCLGGDVCVSLGVAVCACARIHTVAVLFFCFSGLARKSRQCILWPPRTNSTLTRHVPRSVHSINQVLINLFGISWVAG